MFLEVFSSFYSKCFLLFKKNYESNTPFVGVFGKIKNYKEAAKHF